MTTSPPLRRHERTRQVVLRWALVALALPFVIGARSAPAAASGILPASNPPSNATPVPNFLYSGTCSGFDGSWQCANPCVTNQLTFPSFARRPACEAYVLEALNTARAAERLQAIVLPSNWSELTVPEQLFVLANLERTARGLPPYLGLNAALSAEAQRAATADADPGLAPGFAVGKDAQGTSGMGGAWSSGFTALAADFFWMYADGWGGNVSSTANAACTSPGAAGCWSHRDQLLGYDPGYNPGVGLHCHDCEMGAGFSLAGGDASYADLVELPEHAPPSMTFTWARNVVPYLRAARTDAQHTAQRRRELARHNAAHGLWPQWLSTTTTTIPTCLAPTLANPSARAGCLHKTFKRAGTAP